MIKQMRVFGLVALFALLGASPEAARADIWNKKTFVTFPESVETPNGVLPPGQYVFQLADSLSNRHIVQIFNERQDRLAATVLAIPKYRERPAEGSIFTFYETPSGQPQALRSWFYPGDTWGQEFAYPKQRAVELAALARQPVPSSEPGFTARPSTPPASPPPAVMPPASPEPEPPALAAPPPSVETGGDAPAEKPRELAQARPPAAPPEPAEPPASALPKTASEWPLIALAALFSLGGAVAVRLFRHSGA